MNGRRTTGLWILVALGIFGVATCFSRKSAPEENATPSWQRPLSELTVDQQQLHDALRERLRMAERFRGELKQWPPVPGLFPDTFTLRQHTTAINYVGEAADLRWLVLILEPDPRLAKEPAPPEDDEHHTLSDGTGLHVSVWTQPLSEPAPTQVTAFPAAEGWVQRVRR